MKKKKIITVKPTDVVVVCAHGCNCNRKGMKATTDLANLMAVGMPICLECGEEANFVHVEVHLRKEAQ